MRRLDVPETCFGDTDGYELVFACFYLRCSVLGKWLSSHSGPVEKGREDVVMEGRTARGRGEGGFGVVESGREGCIAMGMNRIASGMSRFQH